MRSAKRKSQSALIPHPSSLSPHPPWPILASGELAPIQGEAVSVDWIEAAAGEGTPGSPKKFSMVAYTGGDLRVERYGVPVIVDLSTLQAAAPLPCLRDHVLAQVVGHADEVEVGAATIKVRGLVSGGGAAAAEVLAAAAQGFPWKASIGAQPTAEGMEWVGEGVSTKVNGKSFRGPCYVARKATLREISFVAVGADGRTSVNIAAQAAQSKENRMDPEFAKWIEALGLAATELREDQVVKLRAKYDAELKASSAAAGSAGTAAPIQAAVPKFDLSAILLVHERHVAAVEAKAANYEGTIAAGPLAEIRGNARKAAAELKAKALNEEWPAVRYEVELVKAAAAAEVELIRAERPKGPEIHGSRRDTTPAVIEAAFCASLGVKDREKYFDAKTLEAADRGYRGIGLQGLLLEAAWANGYTGRTWRNSELRHVLQAAFSTHTITTMLTSAANKLLLEGFNTIPQSWREMAQVRSVTDFKTVTAYRMTASLEYEEVPASGEIPHGTLGQESYTMAAKTYAKMLVLPRADIINDDLGAFNDLRSRLGIGAAIKLNKVFWTAFLAAANAGTFWTAARGNLATSSALGETGLNTAVQKFRDLAGPDGNLLGLEPDRILVPSALEATARKLYVSQEMRDTTASTKFATANIYFNRFRPVVIPELGNSAYTGYSATNWWLAANPAQLASAVMCFLNGQEAPTIESSDADFDTLGIQFRGYHDFGAAMTEYRASVECQA